MSRDTARRRRIIHTCETMERQADIQIKLLESLDEPLDDTLDNIQVVKAQVTSIKEKHLKIIGDQL